jgi:hypothetical protein
MGIDTGSAIGYNALFPVLGINQSSKTFRDNFAIIKQAIERLQAAASSANSTFSISTSQTNDGQVQFIVGFNNNSFNLPIGNPLVAPTIGAIRFDSGSVQYYNGIKWVALTSEDGASVRAALGFDPAPLASPALTGVPTAPTASVNTNTQQLATTAFVRAQIAAMIGTVPSALDSLSELAAALNNDPDFGAHVITQLAAKAAIDHQHSTYLETMTADTGAHTGNNLSVVG